MRIERPDLEWGSSLRELDKSRVEKLIQHHMAHPSWDLMEVHKFHRDRRGWAGIGYNFWIGFDGVIYEARGYHIGAHAGSSWNGRSLGIGYQGHFEEQEMTDEQLEAGAWLNAKLIRELDLSTDDIIGHGDVGSTACPGKNFRMAELRERTPKILAETGPGKPEEEEPLNIWEIIISFLKRFLDSLLQFLGG